MFQGEQNSALPCVSQRQTEAEQRIQDAALVGTNQVCLSSLMDTIYNIGSNTLVDRKEYVCKANVKHRKAKPAIKINFRNLYFSTHDRERISVSDTTCLTNPPLTA